MFKNIQVLLEYHQEYILLEYIKFEYSFYESINELMNLMTLSIY